MRTTLISLFLILSALLSGQELMTFENAMSTAMKNSPSIRQSVISLQRSEENLKAQNAMLKSQFGLNLNPFEYSRTQRFDSRVGEWYTNERTGSNGTFSIKQPILATDGLLSLNNRLSYQDNYSTTTNAENTATFDNNLYLEYSQPIFTYNRTALELEELELDLENTTLRYELQRLSLEKSVAESFYDLYQKQMNITIAEEEHKNNEDAYTIIKNKVDGDLLALEELYQAEVNLATSKSNLYNTQVTFQDALDRFKVLIGVSLDEEFTVIADIVLPEVQVEMSKAVESGLTNRMEIRQREIELESSQFSLVRTKATNEFSGEVNAAIGIGGVNEEFAKLYDTPEWTPSVGLNLNVPIFDWGERKARIKAAELGIESSRINLEDEKIDIVLNIRSILRNLKNLKDQVAIQEKNVENAKLTYEINQERYLNGDLTGMDLNQFQTQLSNKKIDLTSARIAYKLELLNLKIQTLYDWEKNESIVPEAYIESKK